MGDDALDVTVIYREHADFVWRSLQRMGVSASDLEDLLQEVFVVVHRRLHTFDGTAKVTTWLYGISLRVASAHRRRAYFRREAPTAEPPDHGDGDTPETALARAEARERLGRLLGRLSADKRAVFVMFEVEGKSCRQIADLTGVALGTVHSRLHAARKEFMRAAERERGRN